MSPRSGSGPCPSQPSAPPGDGPATVVRHAASRLAVRWLTPGHAESWDQTLSRAPQVCPFLRADWLAVLADTLECDIVLAGVTDHDHLVAGLVGMRKASQDRSVLQRIPLVPYSGVWIADSAAHLAHRAQRRTARRLGCLAKEIAGRFQSATIEAHPDNRDLRPFTWNGWRAEIRYSFVTDLTRDPLTHCDSDVRRRARNAESQGVRFVRNVQPQEFEHLWLVTHERQGLAPAVPSGALAPLLARLSRLCDTHIHGARLADGRLAAANVVFYQASTAYYWMAAFDPRLAHTGANQFCTLQTLRAARQHAPNFDWIGANTPGVADYKQSFGPVLVPYARLSWRAAPAVDSRGPVRRAMVRCAQWTHRRSHDEPG
ncbi:MAG: GNAT family N-acetyltransferase [Phycisphaerae bacterium]